MDGYSSILQAGSAAHAYRIADFVTKFPDNIFLTTSCNARAEDLQVDEHSCLVKLPPIVGSLESFSEWHQNSILCRHTRRIYWLETNRKDVSFSSLLKKIVLAVDHTMSLRVKCYPRSLEKEITSSLPLSVNLRPQDSTHVLAVVKVKDEFLFGITERTVNFFESASIPRLCEGFVSSAVTKLDEAFYWFQLSDYEIDTVIDLGAAPGGWTQYLAKRARMVYSIDGAEVATEVKNLQNFVHVKSVAMHSTQSLKQLLETSQATAESKVDLIVSDMNVTPNTLIEALEVILPFLKTQGRLIATLKFFGTAIDRRNQLAYVKEKLEYLSLQKVEFAWLLANTKSERTVTAVKI